jgi:hypothetical protein
MSIATQNWDGVVAPAIPAGWTVDSPIVTTTQTGGVAGITPTSSPNMLALLASGTNSHYFATYGTTDGNGGNVIVQANFNSPSVTNNHTWGLTARGSASALNVTSTTFYWLQFSAFRAEAILYKMISGAQTQIAILSGITIVVPDWYTVYLACNGSTISGSVQRASDGYWLAGSGSWTAGSGPALFAPDTSITGSGYSGLTLQARSDDAVSDDWALSAAAPPSSIPVPLIVRIPHAYYPQLAE